MVGGKYQIANLHRVTVINTPPKHTLFSLLIPSTEKQLRDAAAAEVAIHGLYGNDDLGDKSSRKRKHMNADEKAKQKLDLHK